MVVPRASRLRALVRRRCSQIAPAWRPRQAVGPEQAQMRASEAAAAAAGRAPQNSSRGQLLAVWRGVRISVAAWRPLLRPTAPRPTPCSAGGSLLRPPCSADGSLLRPPCSAGGSLLHPPCSAGGSLIRGSRHSHIRPHRHRHPRSLRSPPPPPPPPCGRHAPQQPRRAKTVTTGIIRRNASWPLYEKSINLQAKLPQRNGCNVGRSPLTRA